MTIQIDTREKKDVIRPIVEYFDRNGIDHFSQVLPVGDYMCPDNPAFVIDRKHDLSELAINVSTVPRKDGERFKRDKNGNIVTDHARFIRELERAKAAGIQMVILCEHGHGIKSLEDVASWVNPRLRISTLAMSGKRLHQILLVLSMTYDIRFAFCERSQTGAEIVRLLKER